MKVSCLCISNDLLLGKRQDNISVTLAKKLLENGISFSRNYTINNNPDEIRNALSTLQDKIIFIIGDNSSVKNAHIKRTIAEICGVEMVESNIANLAVKNYFKKMNLPITYDSENEVYLPKNSRCLVNQNSVLQGFAIYKGEQLLIFIPDDVYSISSYLDNAVLPMLFEKFNVFYDNFTLKTFGICERDILSLLGDMLKNKYKINITTYPNGLEVTIVIRYNKGLDQQIVSDFMQKIYAKLSKFIYATEDMSLYSTVFNLLKLSKKKLAVGESVTGGNIVSNLVKENEGMSEYLVEGVVSYSNYAKTTRLKVNENILNTYSAVSVEVAYEMAAGLLETSGADIVVTTTGYSTKDEGHDPYAYIAVGDMDGIHVYKNSFSGSREEVIESITKTSMFYLIKKLKQNDLLFNQTML